MRLNNHIPLSHRLFSLYVGAKDHRTKLRLIRILRRILLIDDVIAKTKAGVMRLNPDDVVQFEILRNGCWEPKTLELFKSLIQPGDVVVDVGANVGQYTLVGSKLTGSEGIVFSFEPNPQAFQQLSVNLGLNDATNVQAILAAASRDNGFLRLAQPWSGNLGTSRVAVEHTSNDSYVWAVSLAQFLSERVDSPPAVIKIDVEGHEYEVLCGLDLTGPLRPRNIILEYLPNDFDYTQGTTNLPDYLTDSGYKLCSIDGEPFSSNSILPEGALWAKALP